MEMLSRFTCLEKIRVDEAKKKQTNKAKSKTKNREKEKTTTDKQ